MNIELLKQVKQAILAHPETYDQGEWCGTAQCICGHGVSIARPAEYREAFEHSLMQGEWFVCTVKEEVFGFEQPLEGNKLFYVDEWPLEFSQAYWMAKNDEDRAQTAANRIDHFIATNGAE